MLFKNLIACAIQMHNVMANCEISTISYLSIVATFKVILRIILIPHLKQYYPGVLFPLNIHGEMKI